MKNHQFRWLVPLTCRTRILMQTTVTVALLLIGPLASAAQVTINPVKDNTIYQGTDPVSGEIFEDNSCGAGAEVYAGVTNDGFNRRALLQFDIAGAVPAGSTINSVTLTTTINRSGDNQNATMTLRPITRLWGEGTVDCGQQRSARQAPLAGQRQTPPGCRRSFSRSTGPAPAAHGRSAPAPASAAATQPRVCGAARPWPRTCRTGSTPRPATMAGSSSTPSTQDSHPAPLPAARRPAPPDSTIHFTPTGNVFACCFTSGNIHVTDQASCTGQGGTPDTNTSTCSPNPCPQPIGACCNQDESCSDSVDRTTCESAGGVFQGESSACSDNSVNCGLEPFVDALPLPAVVQPVGVRPDGVPQYQIAVSQKSSSFIAPSPASPR